MSKKKQTLKLLISASQAQTLQGCISRLQKVEHIFSYESLGNMHPLFLEYHILCCDMMLLQKQAVVNQLPYGKKDIRRIFQNMLVVWLVVKKNPNIQNFELITCLSDCLNDFDVWVSEIIATSSHAN
jgi:hypothetical protein